MRHRIAIGLCCALICAPISVAAKWAPDHLHTSLGILGLVNSAQTRSFFNTLHVDAAWDIRGPWGIQLGYRPALRQSGSTKIQTLTHVHYLQSSLNYRHLGDFFLWSAECGPYLRSEYTRLSTPEQTKRYERQNVGLTLAGGAGIPFAEDAFAQMTFGFYLRNKNVDLYWTIGVNF